MNAPASPLIPDPSKYDAGLPPLGPAASTKVTDNSPYSEFVRRILRAYRRRIVTNGDPEDLVALVELAAEVEATLSESVARMRADFGYSWTDVGNALGTSRQAAQQRFGA